MRVVFFSAKPYDQASFREANARHGHDLAFLETRLTLETAALAAGVPVVCAFVNDELDAPVIERLVAGGTRLLALRSAGFNHVDLRAAARLGLPVTRVPAYSPNAVAEHTVALILSLDRKIHRAFARVREGNFSLDGLLGFDLATRTVGVVGTGKIGQVVCRILAGFGCRLLAFDPRPAPEALAASGLSRARRLRGGGGPLLRRPFRDGHPGRRVRPPADLSQRARHRPSGLLHRRGAGGHRRGHTLERQRAGKGPGLVPSDTCGCVMIDGRDTLRGKLAAYADSRSSRIPPADYLSVRALLLIP